MNMGFGTWERVVGCCYEWHVLVACSDGFGFLRLKVVEDWCASAFRLD